MASATSMSVSIECVNICKAWKGDVSGRLDCSVLSCAWKAPRALTGLLASTAHPSQCSSTPFGRYGRRGRLRRCGLSSKSAFQRHKQWLQHAKTRCARHKIMKVGISVELEWKFIMYCYYYKLMMWSSSFL
uniref:RelA-SpoT RSH1 n=1 Tax=Solanum tuberosum TaxID=4113 RepID=M1A8K3_SOLTU